MTPDTASPTSTPTSAYVGLLDSITSNTLDQDYRAAANRRRAESRPPRRVRGMTVALVVLLFGGMLGISALRTQEQKPVVAAERDQLVAQLRARQHHLDAAHQQLATLEGEVAALQSSASSSRALQRQIDTATTQLAGIAGTSEVTGPGLEIRADDAPGAGGSTDGGVILDSDLQSLVNGLWSSGAEAVAINGNRLTSVSSIRFAGRAITVNYRSLTPPYVIDAIGNPDTLPARLLETPAGQAWLGLKQNFGISFDTQTKDQLVLPGDPTAQVRLARTAASR